MAARTSDEILESFQQSVTLSDPKADASKGPLYSLVGVPLADTLEETEVEVDTLENLYSVKFAETATDDQADAFLTNWGEAPGTGSPSTVTVFFMTFSRPLPNQIINVQLGSLISNANQTFQYITREAGQINGNNADAYFNAQRRSYEIGILCEAVANGSQYDLPATLINTKVSQLDGIDAIENREAAAGGEAAETPQQQVTRVQEKFTGTAINTAQGGFTRVQRYNPALIKDVKIVLSSNRILFQRVSYLPAIDYYIFGTLPTTTNETYISQVGGETLIPLKNVPVLSVNSVSINNVPMSNFALVSDTSQELGGSTRAADQLLLPAALLAGDVVVINQTYEGLLQQVQQNVFNATKLFKTDELARKPRPIPVRIELQGRALPSYDPTTVQTSLASALQALIQPGTWVGEIQPDIVRQQLSTTVPGLTNLAVETFQRSTLANSQIETVEIEDNEQATYNAAFVTLTIKNL